MRHFALSVLCVLGLTGVAGAQDVGLPLPKVAPAPSPRVVVVGVDAKTLEKLGPWGGSYRAFHPKLIEALDRARVRGIAFDVYFPENPDFAAETAAIARTAAASAAPVVIAAKPEEAENAAVLRDAKIAEGSVSVRSALDVKTDERSVSVEVLDMAFPAIEAGRRPLAVELALRTGVLSQEDLKKLVEPLTVGVEKGEPVKIEGLRPDSRDASSVVTVSYADVLDGKVDPSVLQGALVLVGMTDGKSDLHPHPKTGDDTSGVYFHAFLLQRILGTPKEARAPAAAPGAKSEGIIRPLNRTVEPAAR